jgi:large subunit ribosomal protein L2
MSKKKLIIGFQKKNGRNNQGKITVRHKGGGCKQNYRIIDFKYKFNEAVIQQFEYDPNRNAKIMKVFLPQQQEYKYILAIENLKMNDVIYNNTTEIKTGNILQLKNIPIGSIISNIELYPNNGSKFSRSSGTFCQLIQKIKNKYALIKLPSNKVRKISLNCKAILGKNLNIPLKKKKKAGFSRWLGIRPSVRGVAMNPIDHPHGGGEGKTSGGRPSVNRKGIYTKGVKTRKKKNKTNIFII